MNLWKRYWGSGRADDANSASMISDQLGMASSRAMFIRRFKRHKLAVAGVMFMSIVTICAIFAPWIAPYHPTEITDSFAEAPSFQHWLGTDLVGRDMLSRLIYAARVSLSVGIGAVVIAAAIGTVLGLLSGYVGGWVDGLIMRITDIFMSFPYIMFILVVASIVGSGLTNIIIILGVLGWPGIARLVRGNVLAIKQSDYVKASVALGFRTPRILFKHILPNTMAPILVYATSGVAGAILDEAALSFLGLGVQPPDASWGNMLSSAQLISVLTSQPWLWLPPGIMVLLCVLSINYIGDALRDAFDPKNGK